MRSNSLYPYELVEVQSTTPTEDGNGAKMVLQLKRGDKHESLAVHVERRDAGKFALRSFNPV